MAGTWGLHLVFLFMITLREGESGITGSETCTTARCFPPFPYCDDKTHTCEAFEWRDYDSGWNPDSLSKDIFINVVCSADGDYPSSNCHTFYRCRNGTATLQTCSSPGYPYFDPVQQLCTNKNKCPSFDCFNKPNEKIGLTGELSSFFSYCIRLSLYSAGPSSSRTSIDVMPKVISRCYGKDVFNPNSGRCEPMCLQEGLIPDTTDCRKYFLCSLKDSINVRFSMFPLNCPQGETFQENLFRCVPEDSVASCKTPFPGPL